MKHDPLANPEDLIRRVYAYVAYRIGDGPDAEDVTSEVFARALKYRSSYDRSKGEALAWLIGIARRAITDAHEQRSNDLTREEVHVEFEDDIAVRVDLGRALTKLESRDQELLSLRYGADLTARQIGELLELKSNAVEVALHRALARLRAALEEDGFGDSGAEAPAVKPRVA
jgi:RNA polymerase sigma-70 factor, ECF subfamily